MAIKGNFFKINKKTSWNYTNSVSSIVFHSKMSHQYSIIGKSQFVFSLFLFKKVSSSTKRRNKTLNLLEQNYYSK